MNILSVQSWVAYGHVGNAAAMFPLQRLGAEVWAIHTVQFSNHTGYGGWTGDVFTGDSVRRLVAGIDVRGVLGQCDAVLSGYMGDVGIGAAILDAVALVRAKNPDALYCCDPVLGDDDTGIYVRAGIEDLIRDLALPQSDIATPNRFELERLTGIACDTMADACQAILRLQARMRAGGPRIVLLTSLTTSDTPEGSIDLLAADRGAVHLLRTPRLAIHVNGAGDMIAALFLFHRLRLGDTAAALEAAGSSVFGVLAHTAAAGAREIAMVAAQSEFVHPAIKFSSGKI